MKYILLLFVLGVLFSCMPNKDKPPKVFRLENKTGVSQGGDLTKFTLREYLLIDNLPKNKLIVDSLISDYLYTKSFLATDSIICENFDVNLFFILFFEKTTCTEYYIEHKEDKKHEIYGDGSGRNGDCSKDCLAFFAYYRSEDNPNMWYCNHPKGRQDTIWTCNK
ncbi:hypothetical protein [Saccharicrinis fermentans]|uniref:Lipoprotein n=1 Tax=Saccharicrinis fermentans DSM 9555 = JCM 21142 TaxID=869213 RepID=W7YEV0_9BACT|nr:hypothetical protein [Saccharicrinis fermentans]GAF05998.1 hypothetical protein JCM21142_134765 [Saccharicrinis fermentans DSM 9555 = JCM 21142]